MRFATLLTIFLITASMGLAAPATKPAKANHSKSIAAVDAAIRALCREWNAAQSGGKVKLRQTCNYFKESHSDDVTSDAILAALERGTHDESPQAYYVKWQVLSGIEGNIPDELVPRAITIYRNFSTLESQPGMKQESRSDLELRRRGCQESGVADLNKHIADLQAKANTANEPILQFRDELFSRLPPSYDTIAAGFEDAHDRLKAGAQTKTILDKAATATQQWMAKANAQQLRAMADALKALEKERGTQYYDSASWSESSRKVTFYKKSPTLDKRTLDELAGQLAAQADNPTPGGLKFKDEKNSEKNEKRDKKEKS